ncbi:hypothetical protein KP79_PYT04696 [Mizuhopecten yessoensis]|uniref:Uncharacterized protein n=1 Tax=Mizuhopecten yessoensis TaxID=6573 RepID=A0A210PLU0_MIZYE|nr:hypothetical protein KP79_PYT04696 [Mizuhopecten yessoensis]
MQPGARGVFLATAANIRQRRGNNANTLRRRTSSEISSRNPVPPSERNGDPQTDRDRRTLRTDPNLAKILDKKNRSRALAARHASWTDIVKRVTARKIGHRFKKALDDSVESTFSRPKMDHKAHAEEHEKRKKTPKLKNMGKEDRLSYFKYYGKS